MEIDSGVCRWDNNVG